MLLSKVTESLLTFSLLSKLFSIPVSVPILYIRLANSLELAFGGKWLFHGLKSTHRYGSWVGYGLEGELEIIEASLVGSGRVR